jgi:hypothetical protein
VGGFLVLVAFFVVVTEVNSLYLVLVVLLVSYLRRPLLLLVGWAQDEMAKQGSNDCYRTSYVTDILLLRTQYSVRAATMKSEIFVER